ncbi:MAG: LytTR family DNA-binding domain-containing protein [Bacilli bacterium]|nr:LytTR family DNA-binding domain-containing protein [Bacilli bacterium]
MQIKIAIIEDVEQEANLLRGFINQYCQAENIQAEVDVYPTSAQFLDQFHKQYNIIFFDIELSNDQLNGMETAKVVRAQDEQATIIFVTNLSRYAIEGYRVSASDYILKPINYEGFKFRFAPIVKHYLSMDERCITIKSKGSYYKIKVKDIYYICIINHICYFYGTFKEGDDENNLTCFEAWKQLSAVAKEIDSDDFVKCSPSYLINVSHVNQILKDRVVVGATTLPLSRNKKKGVLEAYFASFGNNKE